MNKRILLKLLFIATLGTGSLIGLLIIFAITIFLWLSTSLPQWSGFKQIAELSNTVRITRDHRGITHIKAKTDIDAYLALGYAHAQDRLWQMDLYRRIGAGRIAEIIGKQGIKIDRFMRTIGLYRAAEQQIAVLNPQLLAVIEAYTEGVNIFINEKRTLPPEFFFLFYKPEEWKVSDSLVLGKLFGLMLGGNWLEELKRAALLKKFSSEEVDLLMPTEFQQKLRLTKSHFVGAQVMLANLSGVITPRRASNAWVVDGQHTVTNLPILANDPHLALTAPGIWYLVQLETPSLKLTGATVPGMPLHILGHNGTIAWGFTTTYGDQTDLVYEKLSKKKNNSYLWNNQEETFFIRKEKIKVRFGSERTLTIRETHNGPIISDVLTSSPSTEVVANPTVLKAALLRKDDQTPNAIFKLNRAKNWKDFLTSLREYKAPQQNIFFADTSGVIAFIAPAWLPIRHSGYGLTPTQGGFNVWKSSIPFETLPKTKNPKSGFLFNANNRIVDKNYQYFISADWEAPYRATRLQFMLDNLDQSNVESHALIQTDTYSSMAESLLPLMLDKTNRTYIDTEIFLLLSDWDLRMNHDSAAALLFNLWMKQTNELIFADELGSLFPSFSGIRPRPLKTVLTKSPSWCNNIKTPKIESCNEVLTYSLIKSIEILREKYGEKIFNWRWGSAHRANFQHPALNILPILAKWLGINVETSGGAYTLMRGSFSGKGNEPFKNIHGASYRAVYDLSNLENSLYAFSPGLSGNPYSKYFSNAIESWKKGDYFRINKISGSLCSSRYSSLILSPQKTDKIQLLAPSEHQCADE